MAAGKRAPLGLRSLYDRRLHSRSFSHSAIISFALAGRRPRADGANSTISWIVVANRARDPACLGTLHCPCRYRMTKSGYGTWYPPEQPKDRPFLDLHLASTTARQHQSNHDVHSAEEPLTCAGKQRRERSRCRRISPWAKIGRLSSRASNTSIVCATANICSSLERPGFNCSATNLTAGTGAAYPGTTGTMLQRFLRRGSVYARLPDRWPPGRPVERKLKIANSRLLGRSPL